MELSYIDTHAHLTSASILPDLPSVLSRAALAQVKAIVNICTDEKTLKEGLALSCSKPAVFHAAATTPHDVEAEGESFFPLVEQAALDKKLIAIGETGLDYFYEHSNRLIQKTFLSRYLNLARRVNLPVLFHCRDAFADLFAITDELYAGYSALLHCFTGTIEEAKGVLERNWFLSFSGIITFKKSEALRDVVRYVPLERIVIETDSPYLAPQSQRGKQNEPSFVPEVAQLIASIKNVSLEEVCKATSANAQQFFSLPKLV